MAEQLPLIPGIEPEPAEPQRARKRFREGLPVGKTGTFLVNPLYHQIGPGPEGKKCKDCAHLRKRSMGNTWYKCAKRSPGGVSTDHRVRWPACALFELAPKEGE